MPADAQRQPLARFEDFVLDIRTGELCKADGKTIRFPEQSFRILTMLLERPGEVVGREEIRKRLWPNDTVVEFEHSISAAMNRLRQALGDNAGEPRYIETLARRGYRWMRSVEWVEAACVQLDATVTKSEYPAASLIGKRVSHYRVLEMLGGGGMGIVYKAEDIKLGRRVALKFLPEEMAHEPHSLERFEREARSASALNHPNICTIHEIAEHDGQPFIVMELLEGETLRDAISSTADGQPFELRVLVDLALQIVAGLEAAQQKGIIHRDIKPSNIFITRRGEAKILDFGVAKLLALDELIESEVRVSVTGDAQHPQDPKPPSVYLTRTGTALGTEGYMSPEQIRGEKVDARTDLFSFGLVLYEMATKARAFRGDTAVVLHDAILHSTPSPVRELNPAIPLSLQEIIFKALAKQLNQRYQSASEMRVAIASLVRGLGVMAEDSENGNLLSVGRKVPNGSALMVEIDRPTEADTKAVATVSDIEPPLSTPPARQSSMPRWWWIGMSVAGIAVVVTASFLRWNLSKDPTIDGVSQLTDDGNPKLNDYNNSGEVSDGSRIYFNEMQGGRMVIAQVAATGGQTGQINTTVPDSEVHALASDSSSLLIVSTDPSCCHLWTLPLPAGEPRKLLEVPDLVGADLSPGGHIFYTRPNSLYVADKDGSNPRRLFDFPAPASYPIVSPDGRTIRVKVGGRLFEVNSDGSGAHVLRDWPGASDSCCGRWTSDGRYFVYQSRRKGRTDLWALPERSRWFGRSTSPLRLTNGPLSYVLPVPSPDGKHIFAIGLKERGELVRFDRKSKQFVPYLSGISAMNATISRDGSWVTYMSYPNRNLWRSRTDGSERLQLTYPPIAVIYPRISPDGTKVAYGAVDASGIECAYVLPLAGGTPRKVADHATGASWSPNGNSVLIGPDDDFALGLRTVDLQTGKIDSVPGSAGRGDPIWLSEDMFVALEPEAGERLVAFDTKTQRWSDLVKGPLVHWMQSVDGNYLYYMTGGDDPKVMRLRFVDRKVEEVASLKNFRPAEDEDFGSWLGVAPDGSPLLTRDIGTQEIYDLSVRWN